MIRKLLMFYLLITVSLSLVSCARRLTLQERVDCISYCVECSRCSRELEFQSKNRKGIMVFLEPTCVNRCVFGCKYSNDIPAKEWLETKKKK